LADLGDPGEAEAGQGLGDRLPLWVEDLGFGHDIDNNSGH
jgi:hypothetical protein